MTYRNSALHATLGAAENNPSFHSNDNSKFFIPSLTTMLKNIPEYGIHVTSPDQGLFAATVGEGGGGGWRGGERSGAGIRPWGRGCTAHAWGLNPFVDVHCYRGNSLYICKFETRVSRLPRFDSLKRWVMLYLEPAKSFVFSKDSRG